MINVIVSSDSRYNVNKQMIKDSVLKVLQAHFVKGMVEVEVNIIGDRKMHELNKQHRGYDSTTDVLTFAFEDPNPQNPLQQNYGFVASPDKCLRLGIILVSYPQAVLNASDEGKSVDDEINFLIEHGTNHILGIHHN